jgi:hypothetical protein
MPEVSRFLGIAIRFNYREHNPPHFHAEYNEWMASISIRELSVLQGELPQRILALVLEWASDHRDELMADWELAAARKALKKIAPLV